MSVFYCLCCCAPLCVFVYVYAPRGRASLNLRWGSALCDASCMRALAWRLQGCLSKRHCNALLCTWFLAGRATRHKHTYDCTTAHTTGTEHNTSKRCSGICGQTLGLRRHRRLQHSLTSVRDWTRCQQRLCEAYRCGSRVRPKRVGTLRSSVGRSLAEVQANRRAVKSHMRTSLACRRHLWACLPMLPHKGCRVPSLVVQCSSPGRSP